MKVDCRRLWPAPDASPEEARLHWGQIAGACIGAMPIANPLVRPLLIAIRGAKLGDAETHELVHQPVYDDCFVLYQRDTAPIVFHAAAHAYQRTSSASPDADGDGAKDVGSVRPGRFVAHLVSGDDPEVMFHLKTPDGSPRLGCYRDFDHDGKLTPAELRKSEALREGGQVGDDGAWGDSILVHGGLDEPPRPDGSPAKHRFSIGCWTAPRRWRKAMADACRAAGTTALDAILVEAVDLVATLPPERYELDGDSDAPPAGVA
jgi:hypothetical protein